jgi:3',5'-cyclic AMP phosphodiesterase CpdA
MWDERARQCGTRDSVRTCSGRLRAAAAALLTGALAGLGIVGEARAAALSPITKGPYLQELGPTSVVVRVEVDPPAPIDLEVSPLAAADGGTRDGGAVVIKHDASSAAFHSILLDQLKPFTRYSYRVKVSGVRSPEGTFTTAPSADSGAPFTFLLYGDDRSGDEAHAALVRSLAAIPSDFLLHTGDFVEDGSAKTMWQTFFDIESPLLRDRCVFACVGNHELIEPGGVSFARYFGPEQEGEGEPARRLYHTFRWSTARFFLLNGMDAWSTSNEKQWLRTALESADKEPGLVWRIVVIHFGPWSSGPHGKNTRLLSAGVIPILAEHKVDLILSGHDHIYERGEQDGLRYIVSGGGGAPLYRIEKTLSSTRKAESAYHYITTSVTKDAIDVVAVRGDGSVLERCGFKRASTDWDCDPASALASTAPPTLSSPTPPTQGSSESPPQPSRCGCRAVGAPCSHEDAGRWFGLLVMALAAFHRRRS